MIKNLDSEADLLRYYYNYIKTLINYLNNFYCKQYLDSYKTTISNLEQNYLKIKNNEILCKDLVRRIKYLISETMSKRVLFFLVDLLRYQFKEDYSIDNDFVNFSSNLAIDDKSEIEKINEIRKKITNDNVNEELLKEIDKDNSQMENLSLTNFRRKSFNFFDDKFSEQDFKEFIQDDSHRYIYSTINIHVSMYEKSDIGRKFFLSNSSESPEDFERDIIKKYNKFRLFSFEHYFFWFKDYFYQLLETENTLIKEDGFIPKPWRYYIALMAVSSAKCDYLFNIIEEKFLESGGDESWLIFGLDVLPEKLKKLARFNNIFSHQPWKIKGDDLKELTNKKESNNSSSWNINELIQASMIIVHYHKLSLIVQSLRINLIDDNENSKIDNEEQKILPNKEIKEKLLQNLKNIEDEDNLKDEDTNDLDISDSQDLKSENEEKVSSFEKHISNYCNLYHDFDAHSDEYRCYMEFNWNDHGYYILHNLYPKGVVCLNEEIEYISKLTTNSLGDFMESKEHREQLEEDSKLNTFPIRYAVSCYIEKIMGYIHEDYNYSNVNKLLEVNYKKFIKNVSCYPHKLTKKDFRMMNMAFNKEEIMHIILLVAIIKSRTQLTYLSSSIYELIKNID